MAILATSRNLSSLAALSARNRQQSNSSGLSSKITRLRQQQQQQSPSPPFQIAAFSTSARAPYPAAASPGGRSTSSSSSSASSSSSGGPTITEQSILNAFPRPNLSPTLHFSIFGGYNSGTKSEEEHPQQKLCGHCAGPHSTDFCPC